MEFQNSIQDWISASGRQMFGIILAQALLCGLGEDN